MTTLRRLPSLPGRGGESAFLWGARQTGKSTLLRTLFPKAPYYDLLRSDEFERLTRRPALLREEMEASPPGRGEPVVIDEIQKVPALLDEVHGLIERRGIRFVMSGSSARKLRRAGVNLLGGRALRYEMHPLVSAEIPGFDLLRALNHGLLPRHYLAERPERMLAAYVGDYLKEEIAAEALVRRLPAFSRFLEVAAFSNGQIVNQRNVARECGVSAPTVAEYFQILVETHVGRFLPAYRKRPKRRVIEAPKFHYFDVGMANHLLRRGRIVWGSEAFGRAFEHFLFQEIVAHSHYAGSDYPVAYWRTASQIEVDFVLGDHEVAVEVKGREAHEGDLSGLRAFQEEYRVRHALVVSTDARPRSVRGVRILPWRVFLDDLWAGRIIK